MTEILGDSGDAGGCLRILAEEALHELMACRNVLNFADYLPHFQLTLVEIALQHSFTGASFAQQSFELLSGSPTRLGVRDAPGKRILEKADGHMLLQSEKR